DSEGQIIYGDLRAEALGQVAYLDQAAASSSTPTPVRAARPTVASDLEPDQRARCRLASGDAACGRLGPGCGLGGLPGRLQARATPQFSPQITDLAVKFSQR